MLFRYNIFDFKRMSSVKRGKREKKRKKTIIINIESIMVTIILQLIYKLRVFFIYIYIYIFIYLIFLYLDRIFFRLG